VRWARSARATVELVEQEPKDSGPVEALGSDAAPGTGEAPSRLWWNQLEVAWPLALGSGLGGVWIGIESGVVGLAPLLALVSFAPLWIALLRDGRGSMAGVLALGWMLALHAGVLALGLERGAEVVVPLLPGAESWRALGPERWLASDGPVLGTAEGLALGLVSVVLILGRAVAGLPSLALLAWAGCCVAGSAVDAAASAVVNRADPLSSVLTALAGFAVLQLCGLALALGALAEPGPAPWEPGAQPGRRQLVWIGVGIALLALLGQVLGAPAWAAWALERLGPPAAPR